MLKEYYSEREFRERGVRLVYEAPSEVKVIDNGSSTSNSTTGSNAGVGTGISKLFSNISGWFERMITKFDEITGRDKAKNTEWLASKKEALLQRSYANVEVQVYPYERMPSKTIISDIEKFSNNLNTLTIDAIKNVNSYEDLRARLVNFGPKFTNNGDEKEIITNYYKVGNNKMEVVSHKNGEISTLVANELIPYCENYYTTYKQNIDNALEKVKKTAEDKSKMMATESTNISDLIGDISFFTEADGEQKPADQQQTTTTSGTQETTLATKVQWIKQCAQNYTGSVLNSIRDRKTDYFNILRSLAPKDTTPVNKPSNETNTEDTTEVK